MKRTINKAVAITLGVLLGIGIAWGGLETVTHISDLNASWPLGSDLASTSDDHIRNIKKALKTDFPNINGAVNATPAELNQLVSNIFSSAITVSTGGSSIVGGLTIATPSSGTAFTVNSVQGTAAHFSGPNTGAGWNIDFFDSTNSTLRGFIGLGTNTVVGAAVTDFALSPGVSGSLVIGTSNGSAIGTRFGPNGNVTVNAPSGGVALTVGGTATSGASPTMVINQNYLSVVDGTHEVLYGVFSNGGFVGTFSNHEFDIRTNNTQRVVFGASGNVAINAPSSGIALAVSGLNNQSSLQVTGAATASQSFGITNSAGTNSSDWSALFNDATGSVNYLKVRGDGAIQGRGPVAAALVDMTPDTGTFTVSATGLTTVPTGTATWARIGKLVTINIPAITGTSNATTFTLTGLPSAIQPATITSTLCIGSPVTNNGTLLGNCQGNVQFTAASGTITLLNNFSTWTAAGQKSINSFTVSYLLN